MRSATALDPLDVDVERMVGGAGEPADLVGGGASVWVMRFPGRVGWAETARSAKRSSAVSHIRSRNARASAAPPPLRR